MTATSDSTVMAIFAVTVLLYLPDFADRSCVGPFVSICRNQRFQADETLVSSRGNFSFKLKKLWFQALETIQLYIERENAIQPRSEDGNMR
ncbi:hypothetical protein HMPREF2815_02050 [Bacteroides sp. HMSC068A09]|nr:hypothetical protein HMPREF2815_02050 [Bacteroides sp. HMSC068A09]